ncbi:unnamed protein product [Eruca vesicaria subsp. sativa]|uniref:F-box domain-containing protein n=1 Tax=Eruca vesicaria subsp. sativa TaxID=29727 RepID=A0ABC8J3A1_ERUVS|nr:unnamed protein product [Eruca vesicaria subsp. sativa]
MRDVERESDGISSAVRSPNHGSYSNNGSDFISSLPDAILQHILSYIPTKYAIRTSALSKRWKHVWCETPTLSFHNSDISHHPNSISKTLTTFTSPKITSFHIDVSFNNSTLLTPSHVHSWIELAVSRHADIMSLIIIGSDNNVFPDFFFTNSYVKQLTLGLGHIGHFSYLDMIPKCTVLWTSLRNLTLECCALPDESLANILSGCPVLESLSLLFCEELHHLDLSKSVNLTRLEVICLFLGGPLKIVAPHIHYLKLIECHEPSTLVDVSSLTNATFSLSHIGRITEVDDFHQDMVLKMLEKLQNVEKLSIGQIVPQVLSVAELRGLPFPQLQAKSLTVRMMLVRSVIPGLARLLQNSPGLQMLTVNTIYYKGIEDAELDRHLRTQGLNPDRCWRLKYGDFPTTEQTYSSSSHGVVTKLARSKDVVSFIKLVLKNSKTVDTMVLRLDGYLNATEYQKLLQMVPPFTRNKNVRARGQAKRLLNVLKIIP